MTSNTAPLGKMNPDNPIENLLYRHPDLYDRVYSVDGSLPAMCGHLFEHYLSTPPASILDIGCGTGRELKALSRTCLGCIGVDYSPEMIAFARSKYPELDFRVGDMYSLRLGRTFDAITCLGAAMTYALTAEAIDNVLDTFAAHAHRGTLLILELINGARYLATDGFKEQTAFTFKPDDDIAGERSASYAFQRRQQRLTRKRIWHIPGKAPIEDYCEYRLFFPAELEHLLIGKGFRVLDMFDNRELKKNDLAEEWLYVAAIK
uniref:Methyltransferase domain-containing protein n=1 Tax=Candidatus Kentrum sp. TUN TaxID=2126343 RepID=A0A451A8C6_9GAMM|nr:MAG: Methyltransferase domain-containing protein [Candidatus Kentron sp. TUN]VFK71819.1 MAG: Methyltransferase domain-containing protein [Candidatus Kentron sp. TUN]